LVLFTRLSTELNVHSLPAGHKPVIMQQKYGRRICRKMSLGRYKQWRCYALFHPSNVQPDSTVLSGLPGPMSSSDRHITLQCLIFVFQNHTQSSGCLRTKKIKRDLSRKLIWIRLLESTAIIWTAKNYDKP